MFRPRNRVLSWALAALGLLGLAGCLDASLDDPAPPYDYVSQPIAMLNTDWGVLPLPNDFLNPVRQAGIVSIPGMAVPGAMPTTMDLPVMDEAAAAVAQELGYPVPVDPPLSKVLVEGMNLLNGYVGNFIPAIPFSRPVDTASIVPYDGANAAAANLYFVDITDPAAPEVIAPDTYARLFDAELAEAMPYLLKLRFWPEGPLSLPPGFERGHTYMVVMTGWRAEGVRDLEGAPFKSDSPFMLFTAGDLYEESGTRYVRPDGTPANNVLTEIEDVYMAEGARQLTNAILDAWQGLDGVSAAWTRAEVVVAFSWTIATNPTPQFFDAAKAFIGANAVVPTPSDTVNATGEPALAKAKCDATPSFSIPTAVDAATLSADTVHWFAASAGGYDPVAFDLASEEDEGGVKVTLTAKAALASDTTYVVAVTSGVQGPQGLPAVDESYFGLARAALLQEDEATGAVTFVDTPLVGDDGEGGLIWQSKYLDSRVDTLLVNHGMNPEATPLDPVTPEALAAAGEGVIKVLSYLEGLRLQLKPHIDWLVLGDDGAPGNVVETREDLALVWTFTTKTCN